MEGLPERSHPDMRAVDTTEGPTLDELSAEFQRRREADPDRDPNEIIDELDNAGLLTRTGVKMLLRNSVN